MGKLKGSYGKFLRHQARTSSKMTKDATEASLKGMKWDIVQVTPRRTGRLQRSMKKTRVRKRDDHRPGWEGEVYSKLSYALVVNQGRTDQRLTAGPGKFFVVGGKRVKQIDQKGFTGRRMFQRGAFNFSTEKGTLVLVEVGEAWIAASYVKTRGGRG